MSEETKELALELRDAVEIAIVNEHTSIPSNSSHSYSAWTTYRDYVVKISDEFLQKHPDIAATYKPLEGHTRSYNGADGRFSYSLIASEFSKDIKTEESEKRSIESIPEEMSKEIITTYLPQCNEEDVYCFMYGKEKGEKLYSEELWIKNHIIGDESVTRSTVGAIGGHFEFNGEPYRHNRRVCYPIIDENGKEHIVSTRREISVHNGYYYTFNIEDDKRKEYARECGRLSRKYKVDFGDVIRLGTNEDVLKRYKEQLDVAVGKISKFSQQQVDDYNHELFVCGRSRKESALTALGVTVLSEESVDVNHMSFSQLGKALNDRQEAINAPKRLAEIRKKLEEKRLADLSLNNDAQRYKLAYTSRETDIHNAPMSENIALQKLKERMSPSSKK